MCITQYSIQKLNYKRVVKRTYNKFVVTISLHTNVAHSISLSLFLLTKSLKFVKEVLKNAFIKKLVNIDVKLSV